METVKIKYNVLLKALAKFSASINFFEETKKLNPTTVKNMDYDSLYEASRDSVIQRFEFSVELFWKFLKIYLEDVQGVNLQVNTPKDTIREACKARILSESEAEKFIDLLKNRNLTSHIYKEEIAEQLVVNIHEFYNLIKTCTDRLKLS